jgi:hypothetical protein
MEAGTTSFPSPSYLPGDVTYYITDLPTYSSLATCAQEAISYPVFELANKDCPSAPLALVACACVKDQNSQVLSSQIASQIRENCGSTASDDITSALGVFAYYCSAGQGLVTPAGVTASGRNCPSPYLKHSTYKIYSNNNSLPHRCRLHLLLRPYRNQHQHWAAHPTPRDHLPNPPRRHNRRFHRSCDFHHLYALCWMAVSSSP